VPAMSMEQAEKWAARPVADRIARAIQDHNVWVAVEGATIGWVEVDRDRVAGLYVSPSCSRRGVGSVLLALAETSILSSGYMTARLESSQNALNFYLRRGYIQCGPPEADGAWPLSKDLAAAVSVPITYEAPRRQEHTLKPTRLERFALAPAGRSGVMAL
jgi:hypothetical protein